MVRPWVAAVIAAATMLGFAARSAAEPDFSAERFKAHVAFLSDDMLEGREPGTRGHELAARYMAAQFDLMGLKPGGENGSWFQTVNLVEYQSGKGLLARRKRSGGNLGAVASHRLRSPD